MSTPNFQDNDTELYGLHSGFDSGLHSAGFHPGMGSPLDLTQLPLGHEADAFSPVAPQGTVSPKDLMYQNSVPPSGTFTDLSTPPLDSPTTFSQNTSPMFTNMDFSEQWAPLFNDDSAAMSPFNAPLDLVGLAEPQKPELHQPVVPMSPPPQRATAKSSPIPATGGSKASRVAGITRQRKELSPVEFDASDPAAAKRARNTEAARKSRARKLEKQVASDARAAALEEKVAERDAKIANLESQLQTLRAQLQAYQ